MDSADDGNQDLILAAEKIVSKALGRSIPFTSMERLTDPERRNAVYRCFATPGSEPAGSYIVKQVTGPAVSPEDRDEWNRMRFFNDWVGAEFLSAIPSDAPISAHFYGGDLSAGFFVLEDLGEHRSLVGPLLRGTAAEAEAALIKYSTCLGKLHAVTAGKAETYEDLFEARCPGSKPFANELHEIDGRMARIRKHLAQLGVPIPSALENEIQAVTDAITHPGPFLAYIHSDPCPDNVFDLGDRLRLIDFETSHFGHALLDAVYPRMIFPTCWCANRLPGEVVARLETRYREELVRGCPQAQEDAVWETQLVCLCGLMLLNSLAFLLEDALIEDHEWGIATIRPRILSRLEAFIDTAESFHKMPALRGAASQLLPLLKTRWPETHPLPLYPAFQPA